jgi:hypothetical protein
MIQITRTLRVFAGGLAAGAIGVTAFAGATAAADPGLPVPPPVPAVPAPAPQNVVAIPGQLPSNRLVATPPAAVPATAPAAPAPAAVTPGVPTVPTQAPAVSGTLREYLQSKGVKLEPQKPQGFKALDITLPVPARWTQVPDPNVPDAFAVIADRVGGNGLYSSNAQLVVYKLIGDFDPKEAISHGWVDSQQLPAWRSTDGSLADFGGMPSSVIEGTYRENNMTLNTSRRHIIATAGPDKYLVTLSVTTSVDQVVAAADATDAIVNGFKVSLPAPAAPAPPAPPSPVAPAPAAPPSPVAPQMLGLPR